MNQQKKVLFSCLMISIVSVVLVFYLLFTNGFFLRYVIDNNMGRRLVAVITISSSSRNVDTAIEMSHKEDGWVVYHSVYAMSRLIKHSRISDKKRIINRLKELKGIDNAPSIDNVDDILDKYGGIESIE